MTALELVAVGKRYGSIVALADYALTVPAGRVTAFVGANGAGKSTAMRLLGGLREPDTGAALYAGRPITSADRGRIGHMPEDRGLYPDEPLRAQLRYFATLIGLPRSAAAPHVEAALERVGVADIADRKFGMLSLGNRQRAQLALALLGSPDYLLLDEPFSGLDIEGIAQISDLVRSLAVDGVGVLVSSHQLDVVAAISDRVAVIAEGRAVLEGELTAVLGAAQRALRLTFRTEDGSPQSRDRGAETEVGARLLANGLGGRVGRRAGALVLELPVKAGQDLDPALLASAARLGPLVSIDVSQPSLRELLTGRP